MLMVNCSFFEIFRFLFVSPEIQGGINNSSGNLPEYLTGFDGILNLNSEILQWIQACLIDCNSFFKQLANSFCILIFCYRLLNSSISSETELIELLSNRSNQRRRGAMRLKDTQIIRTSKRLKYSSSYFTISHYTQHFFSSSLTQTSSTSDTSVDSVHELTTICLVPPCKTFVRPGSDPKSIAIYFSQIPNFSLWVKKPGQEFLALEVCLVTQRTREGPCVAFNSLHCLPKS